MQPKIVRRLVLVSAGALLLGVTAPTATVSADPPPGSPPPASSVVGMGSDTTEYVMDELALAYDATTPTPANLLYSWDATGTSPIMTKSGAPASIPRSNGGVTGLSMLTAVSQTTLDYARSDAGPVAGGPTSIKYIPFAHDAVTVAVQTTTNSPVNLTTLQLKAIYSCNAAVLGSGQTGLVTWNEVGGFATAAVTPFLPPTSSNLRSDFLAAIGVTTPGSCVNSSVQDNEGTNPLLNSPNVIVPYSVAKYLAQVFHSGPGQNTFGTDNHGTLRLNSLNGTTPTTGSGSSTIINASFSAAFQHIVYNVVRVDGSTSNQVPAYEQKIFDRSTSTVPGYICSSSGTAIIKNYGFLALTAAQCGA